MNGENKGTLTHGSVLLLTIQIIYYIHLVNYVKLLIVLTCMRCSDWMICCIAILYLIPSRLKCVRESVGFNL